MADTRILHKKGSHGERIVALNHLEFRVWVQYVLSADDFGVMRASVSVLRADNPCLEREPIKTIERALGRVIELGLIQRFKHQGEPYLWQRDWQDFQGVRYPRETVLPMPPQQEIAKATAKTQKLFGIRADRERGDFCDVCETVLSDSGAISETSPIPAGAGARETLTLTQTPVPGSGSSEKSARETSEPAPDLPDGQWPVGSIRRGNGLIGNPLWHQDRHTWCCDRGMCVPFGLHMEFVKRLAGVNQDERLRSWYPTVIARYEGRDIGDADVWKFWRREFQAWVGTVAAPETAVGKGTRTSQAWDEAADALEARHERRRTAQDGPQMALNRAAGHRGS